MILRRELGGHAGKLAPSDVQRGLMLLHGTRGHLPVRDLVNGILQSVRVREGDLVVVGQSLARVSDDRARLEMQKAETELGIAKRQAANDINVRFTRKSLDVVLAELERAQTAIKKYPKSISASEIDRLELTVERAELEVEQAKHNFEVAQQALGLRKNDLDLAQVEVGRRKIVAPLPGMVVQVHRRQGEWVQPGDTVVRILRVDRLRVEGFIAAGQADSSLSGRPVELSIDLPGRGETLFAGEVVFISPEIDVADSRVKIWAEIENRDRLLRPGLRGALTILPASSE